MEKKYLFLIMLLLTVGFASVNTILDLNGKVDMSLLESDLDVLFKEVLLNNNKSANTIIIEDGKSFLYTVEDLNKDNTTSTIDYVVMNRSHQYDVEVTVSCTTDYKDNISYNGTFDNNKLPLEKGILIEAGEVKSGNIITELIKESTSEESLVLKCSLNYIPVSREEIVEDEEYIVTLDSGYEEKISDIKVRYYEEYGKLLELTRSNYQFLGWYTEEDIKVDNNSLVKIKGNHTLKAKWNRLCEYDPGKVWNFNYTGGQQTFTVPCDGEYKLETWGAQGGSCGTCTGGYGGYSTAVISLNASTLFINIGGAGVGGLTWVKKEGGYNGGGNAIINSDPNSYNASGGGATHIAIKSGLLSTLEKDKDKILIVSGGGGGTGYNKVYGCTAKSGGGGGAVGASSDSHTSGSSSKVQRAGGGTQTRGGERLFQDILTLPSQATENFEAYGAFGKGGSGVNAWCGSGAGYYGGTNSGYVCGGGSGYIGNPLLINKAMYCYNCSQSNEESTKTISTTCVSSNPTVNCAKQGNGYARITLVSLPY